MRKTYIIKDQSNVLCKLTFIKNWLMDKDEVSFRLVETKLKNHRGFSEDIKESSFSSGIINIKTGEISFEELTNYGKDFIRKQWLKNKGDFLKSRK